MEAQYICRYHKHQPSAHQCSSTVVKHIKAPVDIVIALSIFLYVCVCVESFSNLL